MKLQVAVIVAIMNLLLYLAFGGFTFAVFFTLRVPDVVANQASDIYASIVLSAVNTLLQDLPFTIQYVRFTAVHYRFRCGIDHYDMFGDVAVSVTSVDNH